MKFYEKSVGEWLQTLAILMFGFSISAVAATWLFTEGNIGGGVMITVLFLAMFRFSHSILSNGIKISLREGYVIGCDHRIPRLQAQAELAFIERAHQRGIDETFELHLDADNTFTINSLAWQQGQDAKKLIGYDFLDKAFKKTDSGEYNVVPKVESILIDGGQKVKMHSLFTWTELNGLTVNELYFRDVRGLEVEKIKIYFPGLARVQEFKINPEPAS